MKPDGGEAEGRHNGPGARSVERTNREGGRRATVRALGSEQPEAERAEYEQRGEDEEDLLLLMGDAKRHGRAG